MEMVTLTLEEIIEKLGLESPLGFYRRTIKDRYQPTVELDDKGEIPEVDRQKIDWIRGTGRTTAMLINVVHRCQWNNVAVLGSSPSYSRTLTRRARMMAVQCGINPEPIVSGHGVLAGRGSNCEWFADHTVDFRTVDRRRVTSELFWPVCTLPDQQGTLLYYESNLVRPLA